jgi:hypothetical protein
MQLAQLLVPKTIPERSSKRTGSSHATRKRKRLAGKSTTTSNASAAVTQAVQEVPHEEAGLGRGGDSPERTIKVGVTHML